MIKFKNSKTVPLIQYIMFTILVVATPFVVVTKYLQGAVHLVSHLKWTLFGIEIPIIGSLVLFGFIGFLIWQRHHFRTRRVIAALVIVGMVAISYKVQDLYGQMSLYDLQKNWHYIAYCCYTFIFFRAFHVRGVSKSKMILLSFFTAIALSLFDEAFQFKMSHRVFDISDIAKDSWGSLMGLVLVLFVSETYGRIKVRAHSFWQKRLIDYTRNPLSAFTVTGTFSFVAVMVSPLMTDERFIGTLSLLILGVFFVVMTLVHFAQYKPVRMAYLAVASLLVLGLGTSFVIHRNDNITRCDYGLVVYKGLPIPYFDVMIYPDGLPRLVDKKHFFNGQDRQFFMKQKTDIVLVGGGHKGLGGKGWKVENGSYFQFNEYNMQGTQVIVLPTSSAWKVFNRLKEEGKNVLFVIHSTC